MFLKYANVLCAVGPNASNIADFTLAQSLIGTLKTSYVTHTQEEECYLFQNNRSIGIFTVQIAHDVLFSSGFILASLQEIN